MFGKRKRFLRVNDKIFNMDHVQMIRYAREEQAAYFFFGPDDDSSAVREVTPAYFERIAAALKYGKVKA